MMMNVFIESLKRLYNNGKIDSDKIAALLKDNKINQEEYDDFHYLLNFRKKIIN